MQSEKEASKSKKINGIWGSHLILENGELTQSIYFNLLLNYSCSLLYIIKINFKSIHYWPHSWHKSKPVGTALLNHFSQMVIIVSITAEEGTVRTLKSGIFRKSEMVPVCCSQICIYIYYTAQSTLVSIFQWDRSFKSCSACWIVQSTELWQGSSGVGGSGLPPITRLNERTECCLKEGLPFRQVSRANWPSNPCILS